MERIKNLQEAALEYFNRFGFNVIPMIGKKPIGDWKQWQGTLMTIDEILELDWNEKITGIAGICGTNSLFCIDLDKVKAIKILEKILDYLKLPKDYEWVVKTKTGYHIWIRVKSQNELFGFLGRTFSYKKFYPKEQGSLEHAELRVLKCYTVLPPSKHPNGGRYEFLHREPDGLPIEVEIEHITYFLSELFNIVNREKIIGKNLRWEPDLKYLPSAIKWLKQYRLGYDIWRDCGFALCGLGEGGRGYFRELSKNKYYPEDNDEIIDKQFDECLQRYDCERMKLNTLFYYAKEFGYRYGNKKDGLSKIMFTYPLSLLRCGDDILVEKFIAYGLIRSFEDRLKSKNESKTININEIKQFLDEHKIDFIEPEDLLKDYVEVEQNTVDFERDYGTDAYGLIGLDLLLECKRGKYTFRLLRTYAAIKAILGRTNKHKWISYSRINYALRGYKSKAIAIEYNEQENLVCEKTIARNVKRLKEMGFFAVFYYGRKNYYSTYYDQEKLKSIVLKRILQKDEIKHEARDAQFRKRITEERKKLRLKRGDKFV